MSSTTADARISQSASLTLIRILRAIWPKGTAKHAARAAGISPWTVTRWLQGRSVPDANVLLTWAHHPDFRAELKSLLEEIDRAERRLEDRLGVTRRLAEAQGQIAFGFDQDASERRAEDRKARTGTRAPHALRRAA